MRPYWMLKQASRLTGSTLSVLCLALPISVAQADTIDPDSAEGFVSLSRKVQCSMEDASPQVFEWSGYGYARVSKSQKKVFQKFITQYFKQRKQLICAFILIDIRHEPQPIDREFMKWMGTAEIPFQIVFTKADKISPKTIQSKIEDYFKVLAEDWAFFPEYYVTSAEKRSGLEPLVSYIEQLNKTLR